jgi:D-arginine dehydrogenase
MEYRVLYPDQEWIPKSMKKEFCIIGGGVAGLSIASHLSSVADVCVLEREEDLAYHASGRSAAIYSELYVDGVFGELTRLSKPFFVSPPEGFTETPLINPIGTLFTANALEIEQLESIYGEKKATVPGLEMLDQAELVKRIPILKTGDEYIQCAIHEPMAARLDVGELVASYRKQTMHNGASILCNAEVVGISREQQQWKVRLRNGELIIANRIINAAGAWGDAIAEIAGIKPVNLSPLRRSMIIFDGPTDSDFSAWPAVGGISGGYYFMPEAGKLMGSCADEVLSPACDAQPEEYDIALAAYNIEAATTLKIKQIHHKWAGLRTFAPDRQPVIGYDPACPEFFWCVGQGGAGIQTAPALSQIAASLALNETPDEMLVNVGSTVRLQMT